MPSSSIHSLIRGSFLETLTAALAPSPSWALLCFLFVFAF
jgi:hypothetical protein